MEEAKEYNVILIGCGGVGIKLAKDVARMLEFQAPYSTLTLVDGDFYEPKNKNRQEFEKLGNKASVLASTLAEEFEDTFVIDKASWVVGEYPPKDESQKEVEETDDQVEDKNDEEDDEKPEATLITAEYLLFEDAIVFCVVDNNAARKVVFEAAEKLNNIDVLTGGNDDELFGSVYHYRRRDGQDMITHPFEVQPEIANPEDKNPGDLSCEERAKLEGGQQTVAANSAVAAYLAGKMSLIVGEAEADDDKLLETAQIFFDLKQGLALAHDQRIE